MRARAAGLACAVVVLAAAQAAAFERDTGITAFEREIDLARIPRELEDTDSVFDYLSARTHIGYGFDETINDNLFLRDNDKLTEYISTVESEIFFADPRGAVLYGFDYEVNAFRYHVSDKNAINHDVRAFIDYDPDGRYKLGLDYKHYTRNDLVFGPDIGDIIRRSSDFQRTLTHRVNGKLEYALSERTTLIPQLEYDASDHQIVDDTGSDRRVFEAIVDVERDMNPVWSVFTGIEYQDATLPRNKLLDYEVYGWRLGTNYEVSDLVELDGLVEVLRQEFQTGSSETVVGFSGGVEYQFGPRTLINLKFSDTRQSSFAANRRQVRVLQASTSVEYEVTPVLGWSFGGGYTRQVSDAEDALPGSAASGEVVNSFFNVVTGIAWRLRERVNLTVDYGYSRSKTFDFTNNIVVVGFEGEL